MPRSEAKKRADNKWRAEKMHRVALDLTLSDYEKVKAAAAAAGVPVGTFCRAAVFEKTQKGSGTGAEQ